MFKVIFYVVSLIVAQGAWAQDTLKVHVQVQHIVIDNSNLQRPAFDFSTVCEVDSTINFQDVRGWSSNNGLPAALPNCSFEFLGSKKNLNLWAGAGAYIQKDQNGVPTDKFSAQGVLKIAHDTSTIWGVFKKNDVDGIELTVNTPERSNSASPTKKESLRVTYKFYN